MVQCFFSALRGIFDHFDCFELYKTSFRDVTRLISNDHIFPRGSLYLHLPAQSNDLGQIKSESEVKSVASSFLLFHLDCNINVTWKWEKIMKQKAAIMIKTPEKTICSLNIFLGHRNSWSKWTRNISRFEVNKLLSK